MPPPSFHHLMSLTAHHSPFSHHSMILPTDKDAESTFAPLPHALMYHVSSGKLGVSTTVDPQKLDAQHTDELATVSNFSSFLQPICKNESDVTMMSIKKEMDEDYGFSKFAADRDASRNEEEMDEDTKLLMSEEGRKLSSKERRQLRNKVSARNFRERRKEYILHLESLVSKHQNEAEKYKSQVDILKQEKDELAQELAKMKISLSVAPELSRTAHSTTLPASPQLFRTQSRCDTPTRDHHGLIKSLPKDINPYSANAGSFIGEWPLSNMASPSTGHFDFNLNSYTTVFSVRPSILAPSYSEKELLGKSTPAQDTSKPSECLAAFDRVLSSILGNNWSHDS